MSNIIALPPVLEEPSKSILLNIIGEKQRRLNSIENSVILHGYDYISSSNQIIEFLNMVYLKKNDLRHCISYNCVVLSC